MMKFETRNYQESLLIAANIYLLVALVLKLYTQKEIAEYFPEKSGYLFNDSLFFNQIFKEFLEVHLGVSLSELLPYIQHSARLYACLDKVVHQSFAAEVFDSSQDQTVSKLLFPSGTKGDRVKAIAVSKSARKRTEKPLTEAARTTGGAKDQRTSAIKRPKSTQKNVEAAEKSSTKLSDVATPQRKRRTNKPTDRISTQKPEYHQHNSLALRSMLDQQDHRKQTANFG